MPNLAGNKYESSSIQRYSNSSRPNFVASFEKVVNPDGTKRAVASLFVTALDKDGNRLFQDGHKASLRREVNATTLQDIQLAMLNSGSEYKLEEAKADLKS